MSIADGWSEEPLHLAVDTLNKIFYGIHPDSTTGDISHCFFGGEARQKNKLCLLLVGESSPWSDNTLLLGALPVV